MASDTTRAAPAKVRRNDVWQARLGEESAHYDRVREVFGYSRSEAIRRALTLLEHEAESRLIARSYDEFYGVGHEPVESEVAR